MAKTSSDKIENQCPPSIFKHPTVYLCEQYIDSYTELDSLLKCEEFDFLFCSEFCLKSHMEETHIFKCNYCDTILKTEPDLNQHKKESHVFSCNQCDFVGWSSACVSNHMIVKHRVTGHLEKENFCNEE